jgi:hypothetical protein
LTWCDEILIPAHLLDFYQSLNAKLSIHVLFRREIGDAEKIAKNALEFARTYFNADFQRQYLSGEIDRFIRGV